MTKQILLNDSRIEIQFPYDMELISKVRTITDREWNRTKSCWELPATPFHAQQAIQTLKKAGFTISSDVQKLSNKETNRTQNITRSDYPRGLYPFQRECVDFALRANGRCIIADSMGVGKSVEALGYIHMVGGRTLIISPANVVYKWEREVQVWLPDATIQVVAKGKDELTDADVLIMSYSIAVNVFTRLERQSFDNLIVDEHHYIKNSKAARTRVIKALSRNIEHTLFLSGTPFLNRPIELFPVLNMIDPIGYKNFYAFAKAYCGAYYDDGMWVFPPFTLTNQAELQARTKDILIRRTSREVLTDLPELTRSIIPVTIKNMSEYKQVKKEVKKWVALNRKAYENPEHALTKLNILRQVLGRGKVEAAIELAESVLDDPERKVVLFAHHKEIVASLYNGLKQYGVGIIAGDTPSREREQNSNLFLMSDSQMRGMIITTAGSEGIDLYSASDIIFVEREWTPAREEQAEARLHRIGQRNHVTAHYLVARGTVDERLSYVVDKKREIIGQVIRQDEVLTEILKELL